MAMSSRLGCTLPALGTSSMGRLLTAFESWEEFCTILSVFGNRELGIGRSQDGPANSLRRLEFHTGTFHIEAFVKDKEIDLIEVNPRPGGGGVIEMNEHLSGGQPIDRLRQPLVRWAPFEVTAVSEPQHNVCVALSSVGQESMQVCSSHDCAKDKIGDEHDARKVDANGKTR